MKHNDDFLAAISFEKKMGENGGRPTTATFCSFLASIKPVEVLITRRRLSTGLVLTSPQSEGR